MHEAFNDRNRNGNKQHGRNSHAEAEMNQIAQEHFRCNAANVQNESQQGNHPQPDRRTRPRCAQSPHNKNAACKVSQSTEHQQKTAQSQLIHKNIYLKR